MEHNLIHAAATVAIPAMFALAAIFWCTEFYRPSTFRKPWYLAMMMVSASCVALTAAMFIAALGIG
jgi:hypothetical protein